MATVTILIIEDELIVSEDLKLTLEELGYGVSGQAVSYEEAINLLDKELPDLALIDIYIEGPKDGIELAQTIRQKYNIPLIFLTSFADKKTVERAKQIQPDGYLVKPFEPKDLYASIEIAFSNFVNKTKSTLPSDPNNFLLKDCIYIRKDYAFEKICFNDLKWITARGNYLELHCKEKKHLIRSTLKDLMDRLPNEHFMQVHRSHLVNVQYIELVDYDFVTVHNKKIPIGRSYLESIQKRLNISF